MHTFAVDFFGFRLSYGDLLWLAAGAALAILFMLVMGLLRQALRENRANKKRIAELEMIAKAGFPAPELTPEQVARIHGHPTLHSAEWFDKQKDWRKP